MHTDQRRQELDIDDEQGLLRLQEEFLKAHTTIKPAAKATRVKKSAPNAAAAAAPRSPQQAAQQQGSLCQAEGGLKDTE
eukprot:gene14809-14987_t